MSSDVSNVPSQHALGTIDSPTPQAEFSRATYRLQEAQSTYSLIKMALVTVSLLGILWLVFTGSGILLVALARGRDAASSGSLHLFSVVVVLACWVSALSGLFLAFAMHRSYLHRAGKDDAPAGEHKDRASI